MKRCPLEFKAGLFEVLFLGATGFLLAACSSAGYHKGDAAALSVQNAAAEVHSESQALETTLTALKSLMEQPSADLKQPLKNYSEALDQLIAAADRTEATGNKMAQRSAEYLQSWEKEISTIEYEHIREVSQARRTEVKSQCEAVNQRYADAQSVVRPMIGYLEDIRRALKSDLTEGGLEALRPVAQNAATNADKVQTALAALVTALNDTGSKLSSSVTATAQATQ